MLNFALFRRRPLALNTSLHSWRSRIRTEIKPKSVEILCSGTRRSHSYVVVPNRTSWDLLARPRPPSPPSYVVVPNRTSWDLLARRRPSRSSIVRRSTPSGRKSIARYLPARRLDFAADALANSYFSLRRARFVKLLRLRFSMDVLATLLVWPSGGAHQHRPRRHHFSLDLLANSP